MPTFFVNQHGFEAEDSLSAFNEYTKIYRPGLSVRVFSEKKDQSWWYDSYGKLVRYSREEYLSDEYRLVFYEEFQRRNQKTYFLIRNAYTLFKLPEDIRPGVGILEKYELNDQGFNKVCIEGSFYDKREQILEWIRENSPDGWSIWSDNANTELRLKNASDAIAAKFVL
jgi:hypothetical protein